MSRKSRREKRSAGKTENQGQLITELLNFFNRNFDENFTKPQLVKVLRLKEKKHISALFSAIDTLEKNKKIEQIENGLYQSTFKPRMLEGRIDHVNQRFAYLISEGQEMDLVVDSNDLHGAIDGDIVKAMVVAGKERNDEREVAEVVEIVKRKKDEFVGRIELGRNTAFVIPDSRKIYFDFFIPVDETMNAKNGEKVLVKFVEWKPRDKNPIGKVVKVLGKAGDNNVEMHSIMAEFGLPIEFPKEVEQEAEKIEWQLSKEELKKRKDFREVLTFTIDPVDAKDFDDALSIKKLSNGNWEIGVHIADVTHYIKYGTRLEDEALKRATSVYLVDRCIPMLPEKLSNDLCSLKPNVDRFTFSAVFEFDEEAVLKKEWFGKTIIHSDRRFSYEEVQAIIEAGEGAYFEEISVLNNLHKKLRANRFKNGAVNFETTEVKFKLDENGVPLGVFPKVRKEAHMLIEEFMLMANKRVAQFVFDYKKGKDKNVMVYRTHDLPDLDRLKSFALFAKKFGYKIEPESKDISKELNKMMDSIQGKPEEGTLQNLAVRSMAKAKYTTNPMGHFGLAFEHYSHFTSPIRRYPDMMAHRLLEMYLADNIKAERKDMEDKAKHSSDMEKLAAEAERASIKYKQAEFMSKLIGQEFDGMVSGITEWGVFVEIIENKCEGLVRYQDMKDDFYEYDQANFRAVGRKYKNVITFGDKVRVKVKSADLSKRTVDLQITETLA
jgi:ribonuclease R